MTAQQPLHSSPEEAGRLAQAFFQQGLSCYDSLLRAIAEAYHSRLSEAVSSALSAAVGAFIPPNTCGAKAGAVMVLDTLISHSNRGATDAAAYRPVVDLAEEIEQNYRSLVCRELGSAAARYAFVDSYATPARQKNCQEMVAFCAQLCAKYVETQLAV